MNKTRYIRCPRCGQPTRIPILWVLGVEVVFRCPHCKLPFKTGYQAGALLFGLSLSISVAVVQLLVYLFSIYTMGLFVLLLVPVWLGVGFVLRRGFLIRKTRRQLKRGLFSTPAAPASSPTDPDDFTAYP